jgi:hypothetical protein
MWLAFELLPKVRLKIHRRQNAPSRLFESQLQTLSAYFFPPDNARIWFVSKSVVKRSRQHCIQVEATLEVEIGGVERGLESTLHTFHALGHEGEFAEAL